jgi:H+-transporting ATPase
VLAVIGTQIVATFIAVYGLFMSPLGWAYAGVVWGYCLILFLIQDRVKLLGYRIFGKTQPKLPVKAN